LECYPFLARPQPHQLVVRTGLSALGLFAARWPAKSSGRLHGIASFVLSC
jgi:hypothetical protein